MVKIDLCTKNKPCVTCTDTKCWHAGDIGADCPKYHCDRPEPFVLECDTCAWIKKLIADQYGIEV